MGKGILKGYGKRSKGKIDGKARRPK